MWILALLVSLSGLTEEIAITPQRQAESAKAVLVAVSVRSGINSPTLSEKDIRDKAIETLKKKGMAAEWANPENKSTTHLLKAYLGTMVACAATVLAAPGGEEFRLKTLCSAVRREIVDPKLPPKSDNTKQKTVWEKSNERSDVRRSTIESEITHSIDTMLAELADKYSKGELKTHLSGEK